MTTLKSDENSKSYHHGDLRNTLIRVGVEMLDEGGEANLSLRKLAKRVGVSHNAPYQHFADKDALLAAIAEEGFRILRDDYDALIARRDELNPQEFFTAAAHVYVDFALNHQSHFAVMFGPLSSLQYPDLAQASLDAFGRLVQVVHQLQEHNYFDDGVAEGIALMLWTLMHGYAAVVIADKLPRPIREAFNGGDIASFLAMMAHKGLATRDGK